MLAPFFPEVAFALLAVPELETQFRIQGAEMLMTGEYRDQKGRKTTEVSPLDAILKSAGFQPSKHWKQTRHRASTALATFARFVTSTGQN